MSQLADMARGQCLDPKWWKSGFTSNGKQRYQCTVCGRKRTENSIRYVHKYDLALQVLPYFKKNMTLVEIATALRISKTKAWTAVQTIKVCTRRAA